MTSTEEPARQFLRHTVATLAYRGGKAVRGASPETAAFRAGPSTRTPGQILAHVNDLLDWAGSLAKGQHSFRESAPSSWEDGTARFFEALRRFDEVLSSEHPSVFPRRSCFRAPSRTL